MLQSEEARRQSTIRNQEEIKALIDSGKKPEDIRNEALRRYKNRFHQIQRLSYEDPTNYGESATKGSAVDPFLIASERIKADSPDKKKEPLLEKSDNLLGSDKKDDGFAAEWEKILEDPKLAKIWLEKRDAKKK